jgi:hypothetical protein
MPGVHRAAAEMAANRKRRAEGRHKILHHSVFGLEPGPGRVLSEPIHSWRDREKRAGEILSEGTLPKIPGRDSTNFLMRSKQIEPGLQQTFLASFPTKGTPAVYLPVLPESIVTEPPA